MNKRLIAMIVLIFVFTTAAISAKPAAAAPSSPGACNMLHTSPQGMEGMFKAAQGLTNMIQLVLASEAAGCSV